MKFDQQIPILLYYCHNFFIITELVEHEGVRLNSFGKLVRLAADQDRHIVGRCD